MKNVVNNTPRFENKPMWRKEPFKHNTDFEHWASKTGKHDWRSFQTTKNEEITRIQTLREILQSQNNISSGLGKTQPLLKLNKIP